MSDSRDTMASRGPQNESQELIAHLFYDVKDSVYEKQLNNLRDISKKSPLQIVEHDISSDTYTRNALKSSLPRLEIGNLVLPPNAGSGYILDAIKESKKDISHTSTNQVSVSDRLTLWFSKYYLFVFSALLLLYAGLPLVAPVLMKQGYERPAKWIYTTYRFVCHQLAYRSFFLFGEQPVYPRELAHVRGYRTYEEVTGNRAEDLTAAVAFVGNGELGYKVALCQRDMAIYTSLLLMGIFFGLSGRKWKAIPWWLWVLLGLGPIGLDGVSQLLSQAAIKFLPSIPVRESTPLLRVLTGSFFGVFTAWFGYPTIEESMRDSRVQIELKRWRTGDRQ